LSATFDFDFLVLPVLRNTFRRYSQPRLEISKTGNSTAKAAPKSAHNMLAYLYLNCCIYRTLGPCRNVIIISRRGILRQPDLASRWRRGNPAVDIRNGLRHQRKAPGRSSIFDRPNRANH